MALESFPARLRNYRKYMGLTQEQLAKRWNYSSDAISAWERGIRTPSSQQIPRIAHLLDSTPEELVQCINVNHNKGFSLKPHGLVFDKDEHEWRNVLQA